VAIEFTKQAEKEQQLKLPVTIYMDGLDSQYKIAKMQIGLFQFMVRPLFHNRYSIHQIEDDGKLGREELH
jgi:hypothetical protein